MSAACDNAYCADYDAVLQEAMAVNGPYAWAYDASDISIGSLAPCFSGVLGFRACCMV